MTSFLDGELSASEGAAFEAHLAGCPACRNEFESLSYSFRLVAERFNEDLEPPQWHRIEEEINGQAGAWSDLRWLLGMAWRPAAALGLIVLVLLGSSHWSTYREREELSRQFQSFIEEREQLEQFHRAVSDLEPVGWVHYNPYAVNANARYESENPYARR